MTQEELIDAFEEAENRIKYEDKILNPRSTRDDIHAFLLLDELVPGKRDIVGHAEHDQIWLSVELDELASVITQNQIDELVICGVHIENDSLTMYR